LTAENNRSIILPVERRQEVRLSKFLTKYEYDAFGGKRMHRKAVWMNDATSGAVDATAKDVVIKEITGQPQNLKGTVTKAVEGVN
jgi:hypothetical protein